ncbi:uncharacterized protein LOC125227583 isoform X1 [Leguminivora glycinivorella]|uniref:uncharacterized protein LOC125227583 isoform X1 n=1 Tax=Leguminivora glycinivorella TaxID=1035111 RepID=UPI00200EDED3|nr:uncharacterized protein LOC125227583 isoform X1 [Leguminivora glycinivorella]
MKTEQICLLILSCIIITTSANTKCSSETTPIVPKYYKMEKCQRSKLGIAAKANYTSLTSCQRLGIEKKALALNFVPPEVLRKTGKKKKDNETGPLEYTCEVLKCAEVDGGLSLVNDSRYDYYSIYAKPVLHINSTCIPATGMFYLTPTRLNYTEARTACRNMSGVLADTASEQRTDALAQMLAGAGVDAALVSLRRSNASNSAFIGANGDSLDCTTYRAWAPGHPRRQHDKFNCVLVTRQKTWRSTSCKKKYQAVCELNPGGPYKQGSIFASLVPPNGTETPAQKED